MEITVRDGRPDGIPAMLGMLDSCVAWLAAEGRTGQWGTRPLSRNPRTIESVRRDMAEGEVFVAEAGGVPAAVLTVTGAPVSCPAHLPPPGEPERCIHWPASDRRFKGYGVGAALLAHVAEVTRRTGISLLRVDCCAGGDGKPVAYYERHGLSRTDAYTVMAGGTGVAGQVPARRV